MAAILVTGASGLLGSNLAYDYAGDHEVWGVFNKHHLTLKNVRMIGADFTDERQAAMVLGKIKPDLVIHCAAATDIDRCQRESDWAFLLNEQMAKHIATAASQNEADLIHISTDAIFSSEEMPHSEGEEPAPNNIYAKSKLAGERAVLGAMPKALVIRTNLFGWNWRRDKKSLAEWFLSNLERGREVKGFADVFFSPILVNDLGRFLMKLWTSGQSGVLHVAGKNCVSKFEFGRKLAKSFGLDPRLIKRSTLKSVDLYAPRAKSLCLDCQRAESVLDAAMPSLDEMIERFVELKSIRSSRPMTRSN